MSAGFVRLPGVERYWLRGGRVPVAVLAEPVPGLTPDADGLALVDIEVIGPSIARIEAATTTQRAGGEVRLEGGQVWPCFVDLHTHLDKGHIWQRAPNPDGTFRAAQRAVADDRAARWSDADVSRRMEFGLRCSYAHGTQAVRTHLDSLGPQAAISWPVMRAMRDAWKGRVELQATILVPIDAFAGPDGDRLADL